MTPQSHPKSPQNWSLKPSLLQSAEVLDNPLFTIRNGPQATLHWPQNSSKIDSNRYLDLPCFSRPPKSHFKLQNVSTWPQHGSNLGPTCLHLGGLGGLQNLPKSTLVPNLPAKTPHSPTKMSPRANFGRCWVDVREIFGWLLVNFLVYFWC